MTTDRDPTGLIAKIDALLDGNEHQHSDEWAMPADPPPDTDRREWVEKQAVARSLRTAWGCQFWVNQLSVISHHPERDLFADMVEQFYRIDSGLIRTLMTMSEET